jgi:membrane associated rhomboid family serine protease
MIPVRDSVPSRHPPFMVWSLIAVNVVVFVFELGLDERQLEALVHRFGILPARYSHPEWAQWLGLSANDYSPFLTSMFLHAGFPHLLANMWTLWLFGDNVEDRMGSLRFLAFYLLCGVAGGVVHWLTNLDSTVPAIGASGAISGVLGAYFVLFPRARIISMFPVFFYPVFLALPAFSYAAAWLLTQLLLGMVSFGLGAGTGGVAWWAHVGGFAAGLALHRLFLDSTRVRPVYADEVDEASAWVDA